MSKSTDTNELISVASEGKTPVPKRTIGSRTRDLIQFISPPRVRHVGWWALVAIIVLVLLVHLNDMTRGWVGEQAEWFWIDVWNSIGFVPFLLGGLLFRYFWPIRERKD